VEETAPVPGWQVNIVSLPEFAGAALAGGRSSRMGTDKAGLHMGGETLLARELRLQPLVRAGVAAG
jgi:molybdopterin-guanine dinucleotide biosynthesis protein A